jgi:uncharacterized protein YecE (DUF72 family)
MAGTNGRAMIAPAAPGRVLAGTSGYDYDPWRGRFYPPGLPRAQRLTYYASRFPALEINASFYGKPSLESVRRWATQVPETFRFSLKAWQRITHQKRLRNCGEPLRLFIETARALGGKLGLILYQLPPDLQKDLPLLHDFLAALPPDLRAAFEFRHDSWFADDVYQALRDGGAALCIAEAEDLATPLEPTAGWGYLRLRRQDYDDAALASWAERLATQGARWHTAHVFFKHEDEGRGPVLAARLRELMRSG